MEKGIVVNYVKRLLDSGRVQQSEIGIISPYKFQVLPTPSSMTRNAFLDDEVAQGAEGLQGPNH